MSEDWIDRARHWMKASGTSQGSLARALDCTRGAVGHYLAGRRQPTLTQMERIAGVMKVHPAWLLYGVGHEGIGQGSSGHGDSSEAGIVEQAPTYQSEPDPEFTLRVMGSDPSDPAARPARLLNLRALSERCYGYQMEPGSSNARAYEGEILVIDPHSAPQPGDEVLVGFPGSNTVLHELVSIEEERITLGSLNDRRQRLECTPGQLAFMHRVIAVVRRDSLPMSGAEAE